MARNDGQFACEICGTSFGSARELEEHNRQAHPDRASKNPGQGPKERRESDL